MMVVVVVVVVLVVEAGVEAGVEAVEAAKAEAARVAEAAGVEGEGGACSAVCSAARFPDRSGSACHQSEQRPKDFARRSRVSEGAAVV